MVGASEGERQIANIVVIDDEAGYRTALKRALELEGHDVRVAGEGSEGLALCRDRPADVVIVDLFMPGKEGLETICDLRQEFPGTRVIAMTGAIQRGAANLLDIARHLGAQAVLTKPFDDERLIEAVHQVLGG